MKNNQTVSVCGKELTRIEYKGELVMTTTQLAEALSAKGDKKVTANMLKHNFRNNRDRFVEGKHFFRLEGEALAEFIRGGPVKIFNPAPRYKISALMLWTKRGVARHCKSVNTDVAWEVFEALEDNYFNRLEQTDKTPSAPFYWETESKEIANQIPLFERVKELRRLAAEAYDRNLRDEIIAEAANILVGEERFAAPSTMLRIN